MIKAKCSNLLNVNGRMSDTDNQLQQLISQYLVECRLNKLAFFSNYIPSKSECENIAPYISYILFCVSSLSDLSNILYAKYWVKYKKIPFDVQVYPVKKCIIKRQFNYISLKVKSHEDAENMISYINANKNNINRRYPILIRFLVENEEVCNPLTINGYDAVCEFSYSDVVLRIK